MKNEGYILVGPDNYHEKHEQELKIGEVFAIIWFVTY